MAFEIIWSPLAIKRVKSVTSFLLENWSEKESSDFINRLHAVVDVIAQNPELYREYKNDIREALVTKHNLLLYRITNKTSHYSTPASIRAKSVKRSGNT